MIVSAEIPLRPILEHDGKGAVFLQKGKIKAVQNKWKTGQYKIKKCKARGKQGKKGPPFDCVYCKDPAFTNSIINHFF